MEIKVLIIDDEVYSVETLMKQIDWKKYGVNQVFGAYSAKEAREIILKEEITLAFCDIEMPGESGLELIEWIREGTRLKGLIMEIVMLTCHPEYEFMRKAMQLGCSDYLLKPIDYKELDRVIQKAVQLLEAKKLEYLRLEKIGGMLNEAEADRYDFVTEKIIPYIEKHLTEAFSIGDLAEEVALNPQYMMRLFKKSTGYSIVEYVTQSKMSLAKELLEKTQWNNEIIAEKVGYVSASYFIKSFKRFSGMTPREYRKQAE
ncbi:MAG: response regulator [Vallitaleaceae bacterium]|nr:response regulator [Vallitaleaceae bacterium]